MSILEKQGKVRPFRDLAEQFSSDNSKKSRWGLIYKLLILSACGAGFVYQLWIFALLYYEYPSNVDLEVAHPDFVESPAITICDMNPFRRSDYCRANPDHCRMTERGREVCDNDPELCKNDTRMEYYKILDFDYIDKIACGLSANITDIYGIKPRHLFKSCFMSWAPGVDFCSDSAVERVISLDIFEICRNCYVINSRVRKPPSKASFIPLASKEGGNFMRMVLDLTPRESWIPDVNPYGIFVIHTPYGLLEPYHASGLTVRPGFAYDIMIDVSETHLLEAPFPSDCTDYFSRHQTTGKYEDRSKETCIDACIIKISVEKCKCFPPTVGFFRENINCDFCIRATDPKNCVNKVDTSDCYRKCKKGCTYRSYKSTVYVSRFENPPEETDYVDKEYGIHNLGIDEQEERDIHFAPVNLSTRIYSNLFMKERYVQVTLKLRQPELRVYTMKPKFLTIELFSYFGGYIGMWLGFALVEANDLLDLYFYLREYQRSPHT